MYSSWLGTAKGLGSWKDGKLTQYPDLAGRDVATLLQDHEGSVWAAGTTWEAGFSAPAQLCAIKGHDIHCYGSDGTFGFSVSAIYEDNQDNLWFGTANRIWRWKPGSTKHYPLPAPMRSGLPVLIFARHAIIEGDKGALLVAGYRGIWQFMDGSAQDRKRRTLSVSFCPASVPEAKTVAGPQRLRP
jgi:ligand-binding sensor domain-containing protein